MKEADIMRAGILDGFQTMIPTAAAVLLKKRRMLRLTQQEIADRAKITLRQYQRLKSGEKVIDLKDGMMPRKSNMDKSMLKSLHLPA